MSATQLARDIVQPFRVASLTLIWAALIQSEMGLQLEWNASSSRELHVRSSFLTSCNDERERDAAPGIDEKNAEP